MNNKAFGESTKIKVNISFEIEIDDLEDLQTGIQALCSSVSFPNIDSPDGIEYHPKWVHDLVESYHDNSYRDNRNGELYAEYKNFQWDSRSEICLDDQDDPPSD